LTLVSGHCSNREQESQPKPHLSQPSVCGINLRYLIAFSGLKQQVWNTKQALQKHFSGNPVLAWHRLSNRVQISDYSLVLFHYRHLIETLRCLLSWLHCYRRLSPPQSSCRWSQQKREPMLLNEYDAAVFQLEHREPAFDPLLQSPPKGAALGALYSEPRPSVLAFQPPVLYAPPRSRPQTHKTPVA